MTNSLDALLPSEILTRYRAQILEQWVREIRKLPLARALNHEALVDHFPRVVDCIAELADQLHGGEEPDLPRQEADAHTIGRLNEGFDFRHIVAEYNVLRACVGRLFEDRSPAFRAIDEAIDKALVLSAERFSRERDKALRDVQRMEKQLHEEARLREEMLAIVSHDLRNPLGAVRTASELLLARAADPVVRKRATTIQRAAYRMERLVADLLDTTSIRSGHLSVNPESQPIGPMLKEVIDAHEPPAKHKGLVVSQEPTDPQLRAFCDRDRILQVLSNLLANAIKFCRPGDHVVLRAFAEDIGGAHIAIQDSGPGIPGSDLPHVFDPYWSGYEHEKRGTGLGLFISKGIVEAHGGKIWVESQPGEGSTFHFILPRAT